MFFSLYTLVSPAGHKKLVTNCNYIIPDTLSLPISFPWLRHPLLSHEFSPIDVFDNNDGFFHKVTMQQYQVQHSIQILFIRKITCTCTYMYAPHTYSHLHIHVHTKDGTNIQNI